MDSSNQPAVVVLDAGHGGLVKEGASSADHAVGSGGTLEKELNLDIASRVARMLGDRVHVLMTRNHDVNLSLSDRAAVAKANNADVFVSIHFNAERDPTVDGTEVWIARNGNAASTQLADSVLRRLVGATGIPNRGLRRADFGQLLPARHAPNTAAMLAEVAFLTNPNEEQRLRTEEYRQQLAQALSAGILERAAPPAAQGLGLESLLVDRLIQYFQNATSDEIPLDPGVGGRSIDESALQIGDIIVSTTDHLSSRGIRFGTGSLVSHAKLYVGGGQIVEAVGEGVLLRSLEASLADDTLAVAFRYPGITNDQALRVRDYAGRQLDHAYNYVGIVRQAAFQIEASNCDLLPGPLQSRCRNWVGRIIIGPGNGDTFFCSQLVLAAFRDAGIPLTANDPSWASPQDIVELRLATHLAYVGHLKAPPASSQSLATNGTGTYPRDSSPRALAAAIGGFGAPPARFATRALDTTSLGWGVPDGKITQGYFRDADEREAATGIKGGAPHLGIDVSQSNAHGGNANDARRGLPVYLAVRSAIPISELNNVRVIDNGTLRTGLGIDADGNSAADLVEAIVHVQPWKPGEGIAYGGVVGIECHYVYGHADSTATAPTFTLYIEYLHLITPDYLPHDGDNKKISESAWAATGKGIGFGPRMVDGAVLSASEMIDGDPLLVGYLGATSFPHVHIQTGFARGKVGYVRNPRVDPTIMLKQSSSVTVSQALGVPSLTLNNQSFAYDVPGIVPALAQPSGNTCWATAATMLVCWRRNQSLTLQSVCDMAGGPYRGKLDRDELLYQPEKADFLQRLALEAEAPASYLPEGLLNLLKAYGPLWITTDEGSNGVVSIHARLLIGMYGDGSIDNTNLVLIDPADGQRHEQTFLSFQQAFEQVAFDVRRDQPLFIQVVHNAAPPLRLGQALDWPRGAVARMRRATAAHARGLQVPSTSTLDARQDVARFFDTIYQHVQASPLVGHQWTCGPSIRGQAPIGFLKGMALSYARVYHLYTDPDRLQAEMRDPLNPNPPPEQPMQRDRFVVNMARGVAPGASTVTDAVAKFQSRFAGFGGPLPVFGGAPPVNLSTDGVDVLRAVFTMLFGLGMCESSGQHCEGADTSPSRPNVLTATSAEAGLFQVSFDIGMERGDFKDLYDMYQRGWPAPAPGPCMLDVFSDGVACSPAQLNNFGAGVPGENQDAVEFQRFSKACPAFAVELAALGLRTRANSWGPINNSHIEILQDAWSLLVAVETVVDAMGGALTDLAVGRPYA